MYDGKEVKTVYISKGMSGSWAEITYADGDTHKPDKPDQGVFVKKMNDFVTEHKFQQLKRTFDDMNDVIIEENILYGPPRAGYDSFGNKTDGVSADPTSNEWPSFLAKEGRAPVVVWRHTESGDTFDNFIRVALNDDGSCACLVEENFEAATMHDQKTLIRGTYEKVEEEKVKCVWLDCAVCSAPSWRWKNAQGPPSWVLSTITDMHMVGRWEKCSDHGYTYDTLSRTSVILG